jgi:large subunit ribosomal protein L25
MVPGVVYGNNLDPQSIAVDPKVLMKELTVPGFFSRIYNIAIGGKKEQVLAKDVQLHPVTDHPLHVDFMRVHKDAKLHVYVPVAYLNEDKSPGIKRGGVLNIVHHTLELICPVQSIPDRLEIDLTDTEIGHPVHLESLKLPEGVVAAHPDRDNTLATIVAPTIVKDEEPAAAAEGEGEAAAGEGAAEAEASETESAE